MWRPSADSRTQQPSVLTNSEHCCSEHWVVLDRDYHNNAIIVFSCDQITSETYPYKYIPQSSRDGSSPPPRSSSEDGRGQAELPGLLREANGAGAPEEEHHESDAASPPSPPPPTVSQQSPVRGAQLCRVHQPHALSDNCW